MLEDPPEARIKKGAIEVPSAPGMGATLAERVRAFRFAQCRA